MADLLSQISRLFQTGLSHLNMGQEERTSAARPAGGDLDPAALGSEGQSSFFSNFGFSRKDRQTTRRNSAEQAALKEFLEAADGPKSDKKAKKSAGEEASTRGTQENEDGGRAGRARDSEQDRGPRAERDEPGRDAGRAERDALDASDRAGGHAHLIRDATEEDERRKHGAGWVAEEMDEDRNKEDKKQPGAHDFLPEGRCGSQLADGTRCLRFPMKGRPHCAEHTAILPIRG